MMIFRAFLLALVSSGAMAQTPAQMAAVCDQQMELGLCSVRADARDYAPTARMHLGPPFGPVPISAYLYLRSTGDDLCQAGGACRARYEMCHRAASTCASNWQGDACKVARSVWGK